LPIGAVDAPRKSAGTKNSVGRWTAKAGFAEIGYLGEAAHAGRICCRPQPQAPEQRVALARVIIPAFRAGQTIRDCVCAVLRSTIAKDCEIVVVDDGENGDLPVCLADLSVAIVPSFAGSAAAARNRGAENCAAPTLIFIDADVIVEATCLERLIAPLRRGDAHASVGNYSHDVSGLNFGGRYKQLYIACINERRSPRLNTFWTAIGAVDAGAFATVGGFDTAFKGANGEDAELGARLAERGFRIVPVANARGQHRHSVTLRQLVKNDWRKGMVAMRHYRETQGALSDNCHATFRDKLAVGIATGLPAMLAALLVSGDGLYAVTLGAGASFIVYCAARGDLLLSFWSSSPGFVAAAFPLMFALDWLRGACVVGGLLSQRSARSERARQALEPFVDRERADETMSQATGR
jgi:GT2 family glycosyltransferase